MGLNTCDTIEGGSNLETGHRAAAGVVTNDISSSSHLRMVKDPVTLVKWWLGTICDKSGGQEMVKGLVKEKNWTGLHRDVQEPSCEHQQTSLWQ